MERPYTIPRVRGFPGGGDRPGTCTYCSFIDFIFSCVLLTPSYVDCSAPNKGLLITGRWPYLIALLRCTNRDTPTLLGYEPTYAGFAQRKDKSNMVRKTVDLATVAGQALQLQYEAQDLSSSNLPKRGEQPEKIPTEQPGQQDQQPASVTTEPPHPHCRRQTRLSCEEADRRAEKRAKVAEDDVKILEGSHSRDGAGSPSGPVPFVPDFQCPDGHMITADDSLSESPLLAMTLLNKVALPRDMENLPQGKANNMAELCLFLAKVCPINSFRGSLQTPFRMLIHTYCKPGSASTEPSAT